MSNLPKANVAPPTEEQYKRAEISTYRMFAPSVRPCGNCGWPVATGYVCNVCGYDGSDDGVQA